MYRRVSTYILKYKLRMIIALFSLFIGMFLNGASLTLVIPLIDKVLVSPKDVQKQVRIFDIKEEKKKDAELNFLSIKSKLKDSEVNLKTKVNDFCKDKTSFSLLKILSLILFVLIFFKGLFQFLREYFMDSISYRIIKDLRDDLYTHLHSLCMEFFTKEHVGEIMSRILNDTVLVHNAVSRGWSEMMFQLSNILVYAFIAFYINWRLAIIVIFVIPCMIFPIIKIGRRIKKLSKNTQMKNAEISAIIQETISGIKVVKAFAMEEYEVKKFKNETRKLLKNMMKLVKRNTLTSPLMELMGAFCAIFLLAIGGREVLVGTMTKGEFLLFIVAALSLLRPFKKLGKAHNMVQMAMAAFKRIFELMDTKSSIVEKENAVDIREIKNSIKFDKIIISYDKKDIILDNICFNVKVGEIIAFVGSSGSGKTSLLNLLPRFYDPFKGKVFIDNIDICEYSLNSLRSKMGIVTQDVILFHDTIKANIAYGHQDISEQRIIQAAKIANAHDFIEKFEQGYDTIVGEKGVRLSGGERQRIAIARAVLKNPPILILDEATSALDTESEKYVQEAIERLMKGRTSFVIAHRLSTVKNANKIIVLDNNQIAQVGTHEELIQAGGAYRKLYDLQIR